MSAIVESETSGSISINREEKCKPRHGAPTDSVVATSVAVVIELIPQCIEISYAARSVRENYYGNAEMHCPYAISPATANDLFHGSSALRNDPERVMLRFVRANAKAFSLSRAQFLSPFFLRRRATSPVIVKTR